MTVELSNSEVLPTTIPPKFCRKISDDIKYNVITTMDWEDDDRLVITASGFPKLRSIIQFFRFPFFALANKWMENLVFTSKDGKQTITVTPSPHGCPTIWDKDFVVYVISHIQTLLDEGKIAHGTPNHTYKFEALELMENINRRQKRNISTSSDVWQDLQETGERLRGSTILTDVAFGKGRVSAGRGFVSEFTLFQDDDGKIYFSIMLEDWIYSALMRPGCKEVLTIDQAYFTIENGIKRRTYEIIRQIMRVYNVNGKKPRASADMTLQDFKNLSGSKIEDIYDFKSTLKRKFKVEIAKKKTTVKNGFCFDFFNWTVVVFGLHIKFINPERVKEIEQAPLKQALQGIAHSQSPCV